MATTAAVSTFRRVYSNPEAVQGGGYESRVGYYRLLWASYNNSMWDNIADWARYRAEYRLYRQIRGIYNPHRRLVDFYAGQVYPGVLSADGRALPEGVPVAIPFAEDTPDALKVAIAQFWGWTNWQAGKSVFVRYGAVTGSVLVEVIDDLDRAKVTANVVWPGLVSDLRLDATGNVKMYAIEYDTEDENGRAYTFKKTVDADAIRFYRDDRPYGRDGIPAVLPNPYGFVPAVWVKHKDLGGDYGAPAIHGSLSKVDEINSLAAHVADYIHKAVGAPILIAGDGAISNVTGQPKRGATEEFTVPEADREQVLMLKGPAGTQVHTLLGDLDLSAAKAQIDGQLAELEQDLPELAMYRELRAMRQITGPAASRVMGDVASNVLEAAANYDRGTIKVCQMAVAIAGWRTSRGDWGRGLSRQQVKFAPFDLTSYARGELDFDIAPRPLIPVTALERQQERLTRAQAMQAEAASNVLSEGEMLRESGYTPEQIATIQGERASQDVIVGVTQ